MRSSSRWCIALAFAGCAGSDPASPPANDPISAALRGDAMSPADLIVEVRVRRVRSRLGTMGRASVEAIWSDLELDVGRVVRDRMGRVKGDVLALTVIGGSVGTRTMEVSDVPLFREGQRWVVFVARGVLTHAIALDPPPPDTREPVVIRATDGGYDPVVVAPPSNDPDAIIEALMKREGGQP